MYRRVASAPESFTLLVFHCDFTRGTKYPITRDKLERDLGRYFPGTRFIVRLAEPEDYEEKTRLLSEPHDLVLMANFTAVITTHTRCHRPIDSDKVMVLLQPRELARRQRKFSRRELVTATDIALALRDWFGWPSAHLDNETLRIWPKRY